jgi:hypothetical protein
MKLFQFLVVFILITLTGILILNVTHNVSFGQNNVNENEKLLDLIKLQNETINLLLQKQSKEQSVLLKANVNEVNKNNNRQYKLNMEPISTISKIANNDELQTSLQEDCENRYGLKLANEWKKTAETWCEPSEIAESLKSELTCYPYHQQHKKLDGRGPDMFCVATNFIIDFSKVFFIHN